LSKTPIHVTNGSYIPSKLELLTRIIHLHSEIYPLFQQAEYILIKREYTLGSKVYERLISINKEQLNVALMHNMHYPEHPVDIVTIVQPLLNVMSVYSDMLESMKDLQRAEDLRKEALSLSLKYLSRSGSADTERSRAASLIGQGRFNESIVALESSRDLFQLQQDDIKMARTTLDLVDLRNWLGDYETCLSDLNRVEKIITPLLQGQQLTQMDVLSSTLEAMANIMSGKGGGKKAENIAELWRMSKELDFYKGLVNENLNKFEEAEFFFKKVLPEYQKLGVGPGIESHLAYILLKKGKYKEALSYTDRLEPIFRTDASMRPKLSVILKTQAEALLKLGRSNEALKRLEDAIKHLDNYYNPDLLWKLLWRRGQALDFIGQKDKALESYSHAIHIINNLRKAPLGYRLDSTYLKDKLELFMNAIDLAYNMSVAEKCCEFIESIKSRTLTTTLSVHYQSQDDIYDNLKKQADNLTRQLELLEYTGYREGWTDEIRKQRISLLDERAALLTRIRASDTRWRTMSEPIPFDLQKITNILLEHGQAALNLLYTTNPDKDKPDKIVAVLIKNGKSTVSEVPIRLDVKSRLKNYQLNLQASNPNPILYDISNGSSINGEDLLSTELLSQALECNKLIVIPHGILHLIPWAGLSFMGKRLFEYCPVGILPNLSCILNLDTTLSMEPRIALIGSPDYTKLPHLGKRLSGATKELKNIETIYSDRSSIMMKPMLGSEATEENFWKLAKHADATGGIFHIACHGAFELGEPMNSGLLLTDSKVDAAEIASSSLEYDEVILSACSTGWRPMKVGRLQLAGDDIMGLPGAFIEAGIKSVLVSISPAHDLVVPKFMSLYHKMRLEGKMPLVALQETQKTMLSKSRYPPYFWIGFTIYGCQ
jgi:CHAT domain-containing protein